MTITIDGNGIITGASTLATTVANPTLTTPNINSAQFATVSGTAPLYAARAWVNFNGTGTVAIRASGNVSSITDGGVGTYTVNFTTAMADANYSATLGKQNTASSASAGIFITSQTTSGVALFASENNAGADATVVNVAIFR